MRVSSRIPNSIHSVVRLNTMIYSFLLWTPTFIIYKDLSRKEPENKNFMGNNDVFTCGTRLRGTGVTGTDKGSEESAYLCWGC